MQICTVSQSTKIYIDQINNYIQKGQGYQRIRPHLLKQLNQINSENHNSDDTLKRAPAIVQNLRQQLMTDSSQARSRAIDVIEDLIKYADEIVQSYIVSKVFCIAIQTVMKYSSFNPFHKAINEQNRLRLGSIVLYYVQKFQSDSSRYMDIFQKYKQLKGKNVSFPTQTYINIPKNNQFRKIIKTQSQKSQENDRIGVAFDSIVEFVKQCQTEFNKNKIGCANTQFVRALKVKAKTLFDLSQNSQGIELNSNEKQQAQILYKRIRNMLKQIQKISQDKIKQQKIKKQKEFAQQKIQQMTPNNKKIPQIHGSGSKQINEAKYSSKKTSPRNLLDTEDPTQQQPVNVSLTRTPKVKKSASLLDEQNQDDEFTQYTQQVAPQMKKTLSSGAKSPNNQIKALKKPPKYQNTPRNQDNKIEQRLIDIVNSDRATNMTPKQENKQLIDLTPSYTGFSKKSIHLIGGHSVHSEQSDMDMKVVNQLGGKSSNRDDTESENGMDFKNEKHLTQFQVLNKVLYNDRYQQIPHDIDFSDSSSQSQNMHGDRVTFEMNRNNNFIGDQTKQPYDREFHTPKKQAAFQEGRQNGSKNQVNLQNLSFSAKFNRDNQKQQLLANCHFGVLADVRQVKAYSYNAFNIQHNASKSSLGDNLSQQDQQNPIKLTPKSKKQQNSSSNNNKNNEVTQLNEILPSKLSFNNLRGKRQENQLLQGNDQDDENQVDEFTQFQKGEHNQQNNQLVIDVKQLSSQEKAKKILNESTPERGGLLNEDEGQSAVQNGEPLL